MRNIKINSCYDCDYNLWLNTQKSHLWSLVLFSNRKHIKISQNLSDLGVPRESHSLSPGHSGWFPDYEATSSAFKKKILPEIPSAVKYVSFIK